MTRYEFNILTDYHKANAIWQGGFLADRREDGSQAQLYAVDNFYVALFYDARENKQINPGQFVQIQKIL